MKQDNTNIIKYISKQEFNPMQINILFCATKLSLYLLIHLKTASINSKIAPVSITTDPELNSGIEEII